MKGNEDGIRYEIQASGVVKRDAQGHSYEEYAWSNFVRDGVPVALPPASVQFRQVLSLEPELTPSSSVRMRPPEIAAKLVLVGSCDRLKLCWNANLDGHHQRAKRLRPVQLAAINSYGLMLFLAFELVVTGYMTLNNVGGDAVVVADELVA